MMTNNTYGDLPLVPATKQDTQEIHAMWAEALQWMKSKEINQWLDEQVTLEAVEYCFGLSEMFLIKDGSSSIGTFFIVDSDPHLWDDEGDGRSGYLHRLVVKREYAGNKLGYKLLELAEKYLRDRGKTLFRLDCMADNPKLNVFYKSAGFEFVRRVDGDGWSANLYEKPIFSLEAF